MWVLLCKIFRIDTVFFFDCEVKPKSDVKEVDDSEQVAKKLKTV